MKLIKINTDHYIVVDNSLDFSETDYYWDDKQKEIRTGSNNHVTGGYKIKITHSNIGHLYQDAILPLSLSEVKELISEIDVEKKVREYCEKDTNRSKRSYSFKAGYNQALEDNNEKKYTEEDVRKAINMARDIKDNSAHDVFTAEDVSGCTEVCTYGWRNRYENEEIIQSIQPKTEWEVKFINGKLKLKQ